MKICLLAPANSIHTIKWANALVKKNHSVDIITLRSHSDSKGMLCSDVKVIALNKGTKFGYFLCGKTVSSILKQNKYDIINAHYASGYGTLARLAQAKPLVLTVWGSDVYSFPYKGKFWFNLIKKNICAAKYIVSSSKAMAVQVKKIVPNLQNEVAVVPFGVDLSVFNVGKYTKNTDSTTFVIVKSLEPIYGIENAINAFHMLVSRSKLDFKLLIYGKGSLENSLKQQINTLNLTDKVILKGYVNNDKIPEILAKSDVFLSCSLQESFGVAIIEAMAMKLPVIATATEGAKEIISNKDCGIIVPVSDEKKLAHAMEKLLLDKELRYKIGEAALSHTEKLYDFSKNVEDMINVYTSSMSE